MPDPSAFIDVPTDLNRTGPRALGTLREYALGAKPPNIIQILSDDEGIGEWKHSQRPDMESFLEGGTIVGQDGNGYAVPGAVFFVNNKDVISLCRPSRTTEMTGQYPQSTTVWGNYPYDKDATIDGEKLLWKMLWGEADDRLYQTGQIGKFLGPGFESGWNVTHPLFAQTSPTPCWNYIDETAVITGSVLDVSPDNPAGRAAAKYGWQTTEIRRNAQGQVVASNFFPVGPAGTQDAQLPYATDYFIDRALLFIDRFMTRPVGDPRRGLPFFLNLWLTTPHDPYEPPPTDAEQMAATGQHAIYERPAPYDRATRRAIFGGGTLLGDGHKFVPPYWDYMRHAPATDYTDLDGYRPVDLRDARVQGTGHTSGNWTGGTPGVGAFSGGAWTDGLYTAQDGNMLQEDFNRRKLSIGFDDAMAALIQTLYGWGIFENTVIIIKSDNGWNRGVDSPGTPSNKRWTNKDGFKDESLRTPLAVMDPRPGSVFEPGTICDSYCSNLDILPTVSRLTNIEPSWDIDNGYALQDQIEDPRALDSRVLSLGVGKASATEPIGGVQHGAATSRYKVTYVLNNLFDLELDPFELVDLQDDPDYATILGQMDGLRAFMHTCIGTTGATSCDLFYDAEPTP